MSSLFNTVSSFAGDVVSRVRYGIGWGVDSAVQMASNPSGQLALMGILFSMLPPVAAQSAGAAFTLVVLGQQTDDDEIHTAEVGVKFSPGLPPGLDLEAAAKSFAVCVQNATEGVMTIAGQIPKGMPVYSNTLSGVTAEVIQNLPDFGAKLNLTCAAEYTNAFLSGVIPTPPNPGDNVDASDKANIVTSIMFGLAGVLALTHFAIDCRKYYLSHREGAAAERLPEAQLLTEPLLG